MPPLLTFFHPIEGHEKERIRPHQFSVFKSDVVLIQVAASLVGIP
jgi:hypothetical protein